MSDVQPYEAKGTFPAIGDDGADALRDLMTAVNGFYYPGDRSDAVASAIAWLQTHPGACAALGLAASIHPPHDAEMAAARDADRAARVAEGGGL